MIVDMRVQEGIQHDQNRFLYLPQASQRTSPHYPLVLCSMDTRVQRAIIVMEENLHRKVTEKEFERLAGLTAQHFSVLFKADTGEPPMRYLNGLRMARARELLESAVQSHLSIKEIAARVGCRDVSYFVRDFEKRFGLSPKRYRATTH